MVKKKQLLFLYYVLACYTFVFLLMEPPTTALTCSCHAIFSGVLHVESWETKSQCEEEKRGNDIEKRSCKHDDTVLHTACITYTNTSDAHGA